MPKTVPADVLTQFALASIQPRYLLTIVTTGGTTLTYNDSKANVTFPTSGGATYTPRGFAFNNVKSNATLEVDRVQISIDNVDGGLLAYFDEIQDARITLALVDLGKLSSANNDIYQFTGIAGAPTINESIVAFPVLSPLVKLSGMFPNRQLSGPCPWKFNRLLCTKDAEVDLSDTKTGTVDANTTAVKIVDAARSEAIGHWDNGKLTMTSGDQDGEVRQISTSIVGEINLIPALLGAPAAGDTYSIERGCDKSVKSCWKNHNNFANFGGFKTLPKE